MHLMVQPEVAALLFQDRLLLGQGLLSRLLTTAPESAAGNRRPRPEQPETDEILKRYGKVLLDILEQPLLLAKDKTNELRPIALPLSNEAAERWNEFVGHVENQIGPGGSLEQIKGLANKLPEHAARLASVLTVMGNLNAPEIEMMRNGIILAEHYASEALRPSVRTRLRTLIRTRIPSSLIITNFRTLTQSCMLPLKPRVALSSPTTRVTASRWSASA
jgi:hypothetical protein